MRPRRPTCTRVVLLSAFALGLCLSACRAQQEDCQQLAAHVGELAAAEGKPGAAVSSSIEAECNNLRPTKKLTRCMLEAQDLAALSSC